MHIFTYTIASRNVCCSLPMVERIRYSWSSWQRHKVPNLKHCAARDKHALSVWRAPPHPELAKAEFYREFLARI